MLVLFAFVTGAPKFGFSQIIGTVISANGKWCDDSQRPCAALWRMYPVQRTSKLVRVPPTTGRESVTIRSRWGVKETFNCASPRELGCEGPLNLLRIIPNEKQNNVITAFFDAVSELAADRPKVYETFREGILQVRGPEGQVLSDGVSELTRRGLNLDYILNRLDAGNYLLELCPFNDAGEPECPDPAAPQKYSWKEGKHTFYPVGAVHPGLYRLYLWEDKGETSRRTSEYAIVLVADASRYEMLAKDYGKVVAATQNWDADDSTAPALRRAYLYTLSR
jgi:hypothetical protein